MPEWDIGPPFSSRLLESVVKGAIVITLGVTIIFLALGIKETLERGIEVSWGLFLVAMGTIIVVLVDYWYLQILKKRRPPKPSQPD